MSEPLDLDAERAVLAACLDDRDVFGRVSAALDGSDFSLEKHRRIFGAMEQIHRIGGLIDRVTVVGALRDRKQLESVGGVAGLMDLDGGMAQIFGADDYCRRVKDKSVLRRTIAAARGIINDCEQQGESREVLDRAEKALRDLTAETARDRKLQTAGEIILAHGGLTDFMQSTKASVPLPWPSLNEVLAGGLRESEMVILAARTSVGKTAAALQIAEYAAGACGVGTALFSLEMGNKQLLHRMGCARAQVDGNAFRHGHLTREAGGRVARAFAEIAEMPLYFDDTAACTVAAIHSSVRRLRADRPVGLVVIDYLQLIVPTGKPGNRQEAVADISRGIKLAAKDFGIPFVVLAQLSRKAEDRSEPQLTDLRESGSQEQDADIVLFLHRKGEPYGAVVPAQIIVKKQRNGPLGPVDVNFISHCGRFEEPSGRDVYA